MKNLSLALILTLVPAHFASAESDSNGTPLITRETGVLYDEYGPVLSSGDDRAPVACSVEMFATYFNLTPGMGQTLTDPTSAKRLHALDFGSSNEIMTVRNFPGSYLAALPVTNRTGAVVGRQLHAGLYFGDERYGVDYLNIFTYQGGVLREYEMREIAPSGNPPLVKQYPGRARPATLRQMNTEWAHRTYYVFGICRLDANVS